MGKIHREKGEETVKEQSRKQGRPHQLTDELRDKLAGLMATGSHLCIAAPIVGISRATAYRWMKEGKEKPDSPEGKFRDAIQGARHRAEILLADAAFKGSLSDPRLALAYLAQRYPKRWAKQNPQKVEHSGAVKVTGVVYLPKRVKP